MFWRNKCLESNVDLDKQYLELGWRTNFSKKSLKKKNKIHKNKNLQNVILKKEGGEKYTDWKTKPQNAICKWRQFFLMGGYFLVVIRLYKDLYKKRQTCRNVLRKNYHKNGLTFYRILRIQGKYICAHLPANLSSGRLGFHCQHKSSAFYFYLAALSMCWQASFQIIPISQISTLLSLNRE